MHDLQSIPLKKPFIDDSLITKLKDVYKHSLEGFKSVVKLEPSANLKKVGKNFFIGFVCTDGEGNYLINSNPLSKSNFYNLPSGKPYFGESMLAALTRTFEINTGLKLVPSDFMFKTLHLRTIKSAQGEIIFDDALGIYAIELTRTQKNDVKLLDSVSWASVEEIKKLPNKWPELDISIVLQDPIPYGVFEHIADYIL